MRKNLRRNQRIFARQRAGGRFDGAKRDSGHDSRCFVISPLDGGVPKASWIEFTFTSAATRQLPGVLRES